MDPWLQYHQTLSFINFYADGSHYKSLILFFVKNASLNFLLGTPGTNVIDKFFQRMFLQIEIKHSHWLKVVIWLATSYHPIQFKLSGWMLQIMRPDLTNQNALFQRRVIIIPLGNSFVRSPLRLCQNPASKVLHICLLQCIYYLHLLVDVLICSW